MLYFQMKNGYSKYSCVLKLTKNYFNIIEDQNQ